MAVLVGDGRVGLFSGGTPGNRPLRRILDVHLSMATLHSLVICVYGGWVVVMDNRLPYPQMGGGGEVSPHARRPLAVQDGGPQVLVDFTRAMPRTGMPTCTTVPVKWLPGCPQYPVVGPTGRPASPSGLSGSGGW